MESLFLGAAGKWCQRSDGKFPPEYGDLYEVTGFPQAIFLPTAQE